MSNSKVVVVTGVSSGIGRAVGFLQDRAVASHRHGCPRGRQMATAEARVEDEKGKLYAHATTTCFVFDVPLA